MRTLELFAGIGGIRLGFEFIGGFEFVQACEISESARAVYAQHFPNTPLWDDVRTFTGRPGEFDCIVGGSPCQDLSGCGKKRGIDGERSSLWWEMLRIIDECRPSFIGWENVCGALDRGAREVAASLRMVGYQVEGPLIISAQELGAPHQRKRIFLVGYADNLSEIVERTGRSWEEQIGEQIEIARQYSHPTSQRRDARLQHRSQWRDEPHWLFEAGNSSDQGLQRNFTDAEPRSQRHTTGQPAPVHSPNRIGEPSSVGLDDGIPDQLVRISADAPWLLGTNLSGWWQHNAPPRCPGIDGKRIKGRRDSINHYGAACVPAQAVPLALRIKYLWELANNIGAEH